MQKNADHMVGPRVICKQLPIEHVTKPGHWVPVAGVAGGKGPGDALEGKMFDMLVLHDILIIIIFYKLTEIQLPENN